MAEYMRPWLSNAVELNLRSLLAWTGTQKLVKQEVNDSSLSRSQPQIKEGFERIGQNFKIYNVTGRPQWVHITEWHDHKNQQAFVADSDCRVEARFDSRSFQEATRDIGRENGIAINITAFDITVNPDAKAIQVFIKGCEADSSKNAVRDRYPALVQDLSHVKKILRRLANPEPEDALELDSGPEEIQPQNWTPLGRALASAPIAASAAHNVATTPPSSMRSPQNMNRVIDDELSIQQGINLQQPVRLGASSSNMPNGPRSLSFPSKQVRTTQGQVLRPQYQPMQLSRTQSLQSQESQAQISQEQVRHAQVAPVQAVRESSTDHYVSSKANLDQVPIDSSRNRNLLLNLMSKQTSRTVNDSHNGPILPQYNEHLRQLLNIKASTKARPVATTDMPSNASQNFDTQASAQVLITQMPELNHGQSTDRQQLVHAAEPYQGVEPHDQGSVNPPVQPAPYANITGTNPHNQSPALMTQIVGYDAVVGMSSQSSLLMSQGPALPAEPDSASCTVQERSSRLEDDPERAAKVANINIDSRTCTESTQTDTLLGARFHLNEPEAMDLGSPGEKTVPASQNPLQKKTEEDADHLPMSAFIRPSSDRQRNINPRYARRFVSQDQRSLLDKESAWRDTSSGSPKALLPDTVLQNLHASALNIHIDQAVPGGRDVEMKESSEREMSQSEGESEEESGDETELPTRPSLADPFTDGTGTPEPASSAPLEWSSSPPDRNVPLARRAEEDLPPDSSAEEETFSRVPNDQRIDVDDNVDEPYDMSQFFDDFGEDSDNETNPVDEDGESERGHAKEQEQRKEKIGEHVTSDVEMREKAQFPPLTDPVPHPRVEVAETPFHSATQANLRDFTITYKDWRVDDSAKSKRELSPQSEVEHLAKKRRSSSWSSSPEPVVEDPRSAHMRRYKEAKELWQKTHQQAVIEQPDTHINSSQSENTDTRMENPQHEHRRRYEEAKEQFKKTRESVVSEEKQREQQPVLIDLTQTSHSDVQMSEAPHPTVVISSENRVTYMPHQSSPGTIGSETVSASSKESQGKARVLTLDPEDGHPAGEAFSVTRLSTITKPPLVGPAAAAAKPPLVELSSRAKLYALWKAFTSSYGYNGNLRNFQNLSRRLLQPGPSESQVPPDMWDLYLVKYDRFYGKYLLQCGQDAEPPVAYDKLWEQGVFGDVGKSKQILGAKKLREALDVDSGAAESIPGASPRTLRPVNKAGLNADNSLVSTPDSTLTDQSATPQVVPSSAIATRSSAAQSAGSIPGAIPILVAPSKPTLPSVNARTSTHPYQASTNLPQESKPHIVSRPVPIPKIPPRVQPSPSEPWTTIRSAEPQNHTKALAVEGQRDQPPSHLSLTAPLAQSTQEPSAAVHWERRAMLENLRATQPGPSHVPPAKDSPSNPPADAVPRPEDTAGPISAERLETLKPVGEPDRAIKWMKDTFQHDRTGAVDQREILKAYKVAVGDGKRLLGGELMKVLPSQFPRMDSKRYDDDIKQNRYVLRGIRFKRPPVNETPAPASSTAAKMHSQPDRSQKALEPPKNTLTPFQTAALRHLQRTRVNEPGDSAPQSSSRGPTPTFGRSNGQAPASAPRSMRDAPTGPGRGASSTRGNSSYRHHPYPLPARPSAAPAGRGGSGYRGGRGNSSSNNGSQNRPPSTAPQQMNPNPAPLRSVPAGWRSNEPSTASKSPPNGPKGARNAPSSSGSSMANSKKYNPKAPLESQMDTSDMPDKADMTTLELDPESLHAPRLDYSDASRGADVEEEEEDLKNLRRKIENHWVRGPRLSGSGCEDDLGGILEVFSGMLRVRGGGRKLGRAENAFAAFASGGGGVSSGGVRTGVGAGAGVEASVVVDGGSLVGGDLDTKSRGGEKEGWNGEGRGKAETAGKGKGNVRGERIDVLSW